MSDASKKHHRQKELLAYAQGFLDGPEQREIEEHLRTCEDCRQTLEEVRKFLPAIQRALTPQEMPTEEMWAKVQADFRNQPPKKEPYFTRMRIAFAASSAVLATTVLIALQPNVQQEVGAFASRLLHGQSDYAAAPRPPHSDTLAAPRPPPRPAQATDAGPDAGMELDGGTAP